MSRIASRMQQLRDSQKKAFIPYIVAGDPCLEATLPCLHALVESGADILELGVPFSDPMAEGPVIQMGHERALEHHTTLLQVLEIVREFRLTDDMTPIVLMGYANPVEVMGYQAFAEAAAKAGVDGVLLVDMPPEESAELQASLKAQALDQIFLIAPTTTAARIESICRLASGYIYYVSLKGVTGAGHLDTAEVQEKVLQVKTQTSLPVCVGFGIRDADSAQKIASVADGVVVGSVLVADMGKSAGAAVDNIVSSVAKVAAQINEGVRRP
ncbi:tryptophan synthase subunit alpha [bacterium]|nr:tryptophan synthase subunit alpha [bacterium]